MSIQTPLRIVGTVAVALVGLWSGARSGADEKPRGDDPAARVQKLVAKQKEVREALRGTWERAEPKVDKGSPGFRAEYQRWTFDGDAVTTETKLDATDVRKTKHRLQLNPLRDPPEITLHSEDGLLQGIYRLDGDTLTIATCGVAEAERPKGFTPETAGELVSKLVVLTLKRVKAKGDAAGWESRAVKALLDPDLDVLLALAAEFRKLPAEKRRALPVAIRDDAVEFTFRGEVPLGESLSFVEFLIAGKDKDYETLVLAPEDELKRLSALRPFFDAHARKDRRLRWQGRLLWVADGKPHSADLGDIFGLLAAKERGEFLDGQEIDVRGYLGGEDTTGKNVPADLAVLPRKPGPAVLQLTLRRAPLK